MDRICHKAHAELITLIIKEQEKNLAADNQAMLAQQRQLENLFPDQQSSQTNSHDHAASRARPRPRPKAPKTVLQTCNLASMQVQLSELQEMFCKISKVVNVNKERVETYTGVSFFAPKVT